MPDYIIEYRVISIVGAILKEGKIKAKNKISEFDAAAGTQKHLLRTVPHADKVIIDKCRKDMGPGLEDFFSIFK